ncbi:MAG TPA: phosphodiester glycosidase family protein [Methylomirabilota bacterium]|nr:phosphodiester glycosidase family protein [Methylomirabilota bacterium]
MPIIDMWNRAPGRRTGICPKWGAALPMVLLAFGMPGWAAEPAESPRTGTSISYSNPKMPEVPWSIHVIRLNRDSPDYELHSTLPTGRTLGLRTLTDQIKAMPAEWGRPIAAVNGDFWVEKGAVTGDPMGLQISAGELISAPGDRVCFWIDTNGAPQMGSVLSLFRVTWPGGESLPIGLNSELTNHAAILYSGVVGPTTRTPRSRELILEHADGSPWTKLAVGETYSARVREVRETGNSPVAPGTMVLALSGDVAARFARYGVGETVRVSTATSPRLQGVKTAVGGGPTLVRDGVPAQWNGHQARHPRTAIGWNKTHLFLVQVDGRQRGLSVGMSFPELADYMVKLGCEQAMNLDGGGSSTCWVFGHVVNSPCYGHEREMANALVVVFKDKPAPAPVPD